MILSSARRATRAAARPTGSIFVPLRAKSTAQLSAGSIERLRVARQLPIAHSRSVFTRKNAMVPIVQAIAVDKFGKQHTVQCKAKPTRSQKDAEDVLLMAKWAATLLATGACAAGAMSENGQAHAASSSGSKGSDSDDLLEKLKKQVETFIEDNKAALQNALPGDVQKQFDEFVASGKGGQVSWGFLMGTCSGFALKKVSKVGAIALGSVFILFQCASYAGYINVDHKKIERDVMGVLDINKDGVFDSKDVDDVYKKVMKVLEYSMPAGSGFALGFLVGFRAG